MWPAGQQDGGVNAKLRVWALPQRHRGSTQTPIPDARDLIDVGRRVLGLATVWDCFFIQSLGHRAYRCTSWTDGGSDVSSVALWRAAGWQVYSMAQKYEIWSMTSPRERYHRVL